MGDCREVDGGAIGVPVGALEDVGFDDPTFVLVGDEEGVTLAPAGREIPVVALDDAGGRAQHAARGGELPFDEVETGGVLVGAALLDEEVYGILHRAASLEDVEYGVRRLLGYLVDDHDTLVVAHTLPARYLLGTVPDDDARGLVVDTPLVHDGSFREGDRGGVLLGAEDELPRTADDPQHVPLLSADGEQVVFGELVAAPGEGAGHHWDGAHGTLFLVEPPKTVVDYSKGA
ncbi:hypothetical protein CO174_03315 [Candidatus Uhrbacteria bacterium CG_4_9_14_3_um_filter_50_9]|uniref:Uncharacterized protein n=1 Tax=Candidatus Uhrbacteria bacterium CG_4_9_14_3_um_filter_50_9 TaxID=1975035 RepID=A0A2M7XC04_9BACT|nr:MAG: hypothetical protein CO174_03315 [Candidatus Uhrbacteria bacterium CG_4_9_14_3_um_filter_50_9]